MRSGLREILAFVLTAGICGALIGGVHVWTQPHIELAEAEVRLQRLAEVIGRPSAPIELETDGHWLCPDLRVENVAVRGYGGDIEVLVAIDSAAAVAGLRVVRHSETPGIGDFISAHTWPDAQRSLRLDSLDQIDAVSGATVTVRAMRAALENALTREGCQ